MIKTGREPDIIADIDDDKGSLGFMTSDVAVFGAVPKMVLVGSISVSSTN